MLLHHKVFFSWLLCVLQKIRLRVKGLTIKCLYFLSIFFSQDKSQHKKGGIIFYNFLGKYLPLKRHKVNSGFDAKQNAYNKTNTSGRIKDAKKGHFFVRKGDFFLLANIIFIYHIIFILFSTLIFFKYWIYMTMLLF